MRSKRLNAWLLAFALIVATSVGLVRGMSDGDVRVSTVPTDTGLNDLESSSAMTWIDDRLFVFGGQLLDEKHGGYQFLTKGSLVDIDAGTSQPLPAAPFEYALFQPAAATVAGGAFIYGVNCSPLDAPFADIDKADGDYFDCIPGTYSAAFYDPQSNAWRSVSLVPELADLEKGMVNIVGVSGPRVVIETGRRPTSQFWMLDTTSDEWIQLPDFGEFSDTCIAGTTMIGVAPTDGTIDPKYLEFPSRLATLDLEDTSATWQHVANIPHTYEGVEPELGCMERHVLIGQGGDVTIGTFLLDLKNRSLIASTPPVDSETGTWGTMLWNGKQLVIYPWDHLQAPGIAFDPEISAWSTFESPADLTQGAIWVGTRALLVTYDVESNSRSIILHDPSSTSEDTS